MVNDTRHGGDDEQDVAEERDSDRNADGLEATPSCVRKVGAKERNHVDPKRRISYRPSHPAREICSPERVECTDTSGCTLTQAKGARLLDGCTSLRAGWERLLDEVGLPSNEYSDLHRGNVLKATHKHHSGSVVRKPFCKLNEGYHLKEMRSHSGDLTAPA